MFTLLWPTELGDMRMNAVDKNAGEDRSVGKIVSLREREPIPQSASRGASQLSPTAMAQLNQARAVAERLLSVTVIGVMQTADNTLFELAQKSDQSSVQSDYFAGMRVLRRRRSQVEQSFGEALRRAFERIERHEQVESDGSGQDSDALQLVSDEELEEEIAIASIVNSVHGFASRMLFPLNERFSALAGGGYQVGDHNNPIAPRSLALMMRASLQDIELVPNVRLILLKLFERATLDQCEKLYAEVNASLLAAGVLPNLRIGVRREEARPTGAGHGIAMPTAAGDGANAAMDGQGHAPAHGMVDPADNEVYSALLALLSGRHGPPQPQQYAPHAPAPMSGGELRSLLTLLQTQSLPQQPNQWGQADIASLQQVKAALAEQARAVGVDSKRRHMAHADEDTIDLVGMLFEVILDDRNLHPRVKSLLSRLMVPYIKLALMDRHLFLQRTHPARRLLNDMANATVGYQEDNEHDERLLTKVAGVVEALLHEFDEDSSVFQRLEADFTDFLSRHRKRTELVEQRAADTVRGRERLAHARRNSQHEFEVRVANKRLPQLIADVLARYWTHHLTITELRQGAESPDYRDALQLGSQLVAAAESRERSGPGLAPERAMDLRDRMARVLALAGCGADQAQPILSGIIALVEQQTATADATDRVVEKAAELIAATPSVVVADDDEKEEPIAPEEMPSPDVVVDYLESARAITLGKWVDFVGTQGESQQAKLAWISPISNRLLFVNRRGLKVGLYSVQELAALLAVNRLLVHDGVPAFDRAMRQVAEKLGTQTTARA